MALRLVAMGQVAGLANEKLDVSKAQWNGGFTVAVFTGPKEEEQTQPGKINDGSAVSSLVKVGQGLHMMHDAKPGLG